jgi:sulfide:quinone oxidoreductase
VLTDPTHADANPALRHFRYLELGHDMVAKVDVTFRSGQVPSGSLEGLSTDLVADRTAVGSDRAHRWFNRTWTPLPPTA